MTSSTASKAAGLPTPSTSPPPKKRMRVKGKSHSNDDTPPAMPQAPESPVRKSNPEVYSFSPLTSSPSSCSFILEAMLSPHKKTKTTMDTEKQKIMDLKNLLQLATLSETIRLDPTPKDNPAYDLVSALKDEYLKNLITTSKPGESFMTTTDIEAIRRVGKCLKPFSVRNNTILSAAHDKAYEHLRNPHQFWSDVMITKENYSDNRSTFTKAILDEIKSLVKPDKNKILEILSDAEKKLLHR